MGIDRPSSGGSRDSGDGPESRPARAEDRTPWDHVARAQERGLTAEQLAELARYDALAEEMPWLTRSSDFWAERSLLIAEMRRDQADRDPPSFSATETAEPENARTTADAGDHGSDNMESESEVPGQDDRGDESDLSGLSDRPALIASSLERSTREVKDAIHAIKRDGLPRDAARRNPDVWVDTTSGEVYPKLPDGTRAEDSIGNILDYLP